MAPKRDFSKGTAIVWLRRDLRLADHEALLQASRDFDHVIPVFVLFEDSFSLPNTPTTKNSANSAYSNASCSWPLGAAQRWWLHHSLKQLDKDLNEYGSRLIFRQGDPVKEIVALVKETGASAVFWHRIYEAQIAAIDDGVVKGLQAVGCKAFPKGGDLLCEPDMLRAADGEPFKIFMPFWRCLVKTMAESGEAKGEANGEGYKKTLDPRPAPAAIPPPLVWPRSIELRDLYLDPRGKWTFSIAEAWVPGEAGAKARLKEFNKGFDKTLNTEKVGRLSPHLHFGEVSVKQILGAGTAGGAPELGWREFARHGLWRFPEGARSAIRPECEGALGRDGAPAAAQGALNLNAWQQGQTGYPVVDAAMRELWKSGWMDNRLRTLTAAFAVKYLGIHWLQGAQWFWDALVDADLAINTVVWQGAAGCGFESAGDFRVFNPVLQGRRFDPDGLYVKRWVPELKHLPAKFIHAPWEASEAELLRGRVILGDNYPKTVVDPEKGRKLALEALKILKNIQITTKLSNTSG